jgi:NADPH:quinone reductase-like Zn-dependent oxidoreductase
MSTPSMQAIQLCDAVGIENLKLHSLPIPQPKAHQALIKINAVSLNYRDLLMIQGKYNPRLHLPMIPCSDAIGEVIAVGTDCVWEIGTRVAPIFAQNWYAGNIPHDVLHTTLGGPLSGTLCEYICIDQDGLVEVPSYLSNAEASTLSCAAVTAWSALVTLSKIQAGQHVLCIGTGGVSLFSAQIATMLGAKVTIISRNAYKIEQLKDRNFAVHHWINSTDTPQWGKAIRKTGMADHVIEVGGAHTIEQSLHALRSGGSMSLIGVLSGHSKQLNLLPILMRQITVQGVFVGHKESFKAMLHAFALHQIKPIISHEFALVDTTKAFECLAQAQHIGKICIHM